MLNKDITFTDRVSSSDLCKLTKEGLLFHTMHDLKEFVYEIVVELLQEDSVKQINRGMG